MKSSGISSDSKGNFAAGKGANYGSSTSNNTAVGQNAAATGGNSSAYGNNATASGVNSTAIGQNATATADNSVALGQGSVANEANTVSVGSAGNERRITNVAPGVNATDAVNKAQLDTVADSVSSVRKELSRTDKHLRAGIAGATAIASMPQVTRPGGSMMALGTGNYKGESAVAIGYSKMSDDGKVILKLNGSSNTRGEYNVGAGIGYQW
ncbi:YadA-like family protein [Pasteurellaceae bacterium LIM206]|nr:YadA-like family protein [Pasteurellaceae bacterium LIM206]